MKKMINKNLIFKTMTLAFIAFGIFIPINNTLANWDGYSYESSGEIIIPFIPPAPNNTEIGINNIDTNTNTNTNTNTQTYLNPAPTISQIFPANAPANSEVITITIIGSKFMQGSIARVNGEDRTTNYIRDEKTGLIKSTVLTMVVTKDDLASAKPFSITVFNPAPGGGTSNSIVFNDKEKNNSNLAANAIFGDNGFMPKSFVQWLMLLVLIFLAVLLFRKTYRKDEKYKETPLKHD